MGLAAARRLAAICASLMLLSCAAQAECEVRPMRITFYTCGEGFRHCLTKRGHQPIPFRTVAVGDRGLLGRWLYMEDLGGWVHASDTGSALKRNSVDVFIGEARMAQHARRLGVHHWNVRVCEAEAPSDPALASAPTVATADSAEVAPR